MLRNCLLLILLISVSTALTCFKCAVFNMTKMSEDEQRQMGSAMEMLGAPSCDTVQDVTELCETNQDQCHKIAVSSKLGGENDHEGYLLQCGLSTGIDNICTMYKGLSAVAGFTIDTCTAKGCDNDKCFDPNPSNGAPFYHYNLYILIASVATFLLSTL